MNELINRLFSSAPDAAPEYLAVSDWMTDKPLDEIAETITKYEARFRQFSDEVVGILGEPTLTTVTDPDALSDWYPEAIHAECWRRDDKLLCLALEHHDRDTPVGVVLRCLTRSEIQELKE